MVTWHVGGDQQFAGASGSITANFFVGANLEITNHHFGVIFMPEPRPDRLAQR